MTTKQSAKNIKWVEGLRGVASVLVLITHIARAFDYPLFFPADEASRAPRLLQLPILRVAAQGRIGVPIFAFLTGFVCALSPLKHARQARAHTRRRHRRRLVPSHDHHHHHHHHHEDPACCWAYASAVRSLAQSAFRRPPRLMLPAALATVASFLVALGGGYATANACDSFWVRFDAPDAVASLGAEVRRLGRTLLTTWTQRENPYDRHQWALLPLLLGAFQVYLVLLATMGARFRWRIGVYLVLMAYWWLNQAPLTETFGSMITLGTMLADLSLHPPTQHLLATHHRLLSYLVAPTLLLLGLLLGSYPQEHQDWAPWSLWLRNTFVMTTTTTTTTTTTGSAGPSNGGSLLVPPGTDAPRRFSALGIQLCALAVFLSPWLREALSHRLLLWLGHHSFAVYLTHGTLLRTVGIWIAYGTMHPPTRAHDGSHDEFLHVRSREAVFLAVVVFVVLSYSVAWAWMRWVDTACAKATRWLEAKVFSQKEEEEEEDDDDNDDDDDDVEKGRRERGSLCESWLPALHDEERGEDGMDASHRLFLKLGHEEEHDRSGHRGRLG